VPARTIDRLDARFAQHLARISSARDASAATLTRATGPYDRAARTRRRASGARAARRAARARGGTTASASHSRGKPSVWIDVDPERTPPTLHERGSNHHDHPLALHRVTLPAE
jgi:hypothetical protein